MVETIEDCLGTFSVLCSFRSAIDNIEWVFAGCMVQMNDVERRYFWDELVVIISSWELP